MLMLWIVLVGFGALGVARILYRAWNGGVIIAGAPVSNVIVVLALVIIVIAFTLLAATQLGFIPDHAP